jgi:Mg/Co/Ni transporter MgtE
MGPDQTFWYLQGRKEELTTMSNKTIKNIIDEAGKLQGKLRDAKERYESMRKKLYRAMLKSLATDVVVSGKKYQAILSFDEMEFIDVVKFLDDVKSNTRRRILMKVLVTKAKKVLSKKQFKELVVKRKVDAPILHVGKDLEGKGE